MGLGLSKQTRVPNSDGTCPPCPPCNGSGEKKKLETEGAEKVASELLISAEPFSINDSVKSHKATLKGMQSIFNPLIFISILLLLLFLNR